MTIQSTWNFTTAAAAVTEDEQRRADAEVALLAGLGIADDDDWGDDL
jgi:hypothetical protein